MSAITWRTVQGANQSDSSRMFQNAVGNVNQGLSGFQDMANTAARKMDAEQLNAALNQVEQLTTMGSAREAQRNGFLDSLSLKNPEMTRQVRDALQSQADTNKTVYDTQVAEDDRFTFDAIEKLIANDQLDLAEETASDLTFGGGRALTGVKNAKKTKEISNAEKQYQNAVLGGMQQRHQSIQKNSKLSDDILKNTPSQFRNALVIDETTGKLTINPTLDEATARQYAPIFNEIQQFPWSDVQTREQVQQQSIGNLSSVLGFERAGNLIDGANTIFNNDIVANREISQNQAALETLLAEQQAQLGYTREDNPYRPPVPIEDRKTIGQIALGYLKSAIGNDAYSDIGDGDFTKFTDAVFTAVKNAGGSEVSPSAIEKALADDPQVLEAAKEGNLGDWFDNVNLEEFTDSVKSFDLEIKTSNKSARNKVRADEALVRESQAALGQQNANRR